MKNSHVMFHLIGFKQTHTHTKKFASTHNVSKFLTYSFGPNKKLKDKKD